jgi:hypothetical protein
MVNEKGGNMNKQIHIKISKSTLDACWVRSSKFHNNEFMTFEKSHKGTVKLIQWATSKKKYPKAKAEFIIETDNTNHFNLVQTLKNNNLVVKTIFQNNHTLKENQKKRLMKRLSFLEKIKNREVKRLKTLKQDDYETFITKMLEKSINRCIKLRLETLTQILKLKKYRPKKTA